MAKKDKNTTINFQISAIELLDFSLKSCENKLFPLKTFHFNINLNQSFLPDKKLVFVIPSVAILHENKETLLGFVKINCIFKIEELADYCNAKTKAVKLPEHIITALNSIALSTCRGVMACQFKGTALHSATLPLIDPKSFSITNVNNT